MGRNVRVAAAAVLAVLAATACTGPIGQGGVLTAPAPPPGPAASALPDPPFLTLLPERVLNGPAADALTALPVGLRESGGYDRDLFGQRWSDDVDVAGGHNGCDTRNDILRRDLDLITTKPGTRECVIAAGTLTDPYTGESIDFVRGPDSDRVQIDHVVSLSDAWAKGARHLTPQQRVDLANDPLNLLAVGGPVNQSKGNGDAAQWLPPVAEVACDYVARQIAVKDRYTLWVTSDESAAMARVLAGCPGHPLPTD